MKKKDLKIVTCAELIDAIKEGYRTATTPDGYITIYRENKGTKYILKQNDNSGMLYFIPISKKEFDIVDNRDCDFSIQL
jgi:hypothetical protein